MYDYLVIGAGVTGANIARMLSKYELNVLVLDKESDIGNGATLANSAIVHSGHDPKEDTLKAKLCVRGNALYHELERNLDVPLMHNGAYLLASDEESEAQLDTLFNRAKYNGVHAEFVPLEVAFKEEPNIARDTTRVLSLPSTKITYPWEVALACMENAVANGVTYKGNQTVNSIQKDGDLFTVTTEEGEVYEAKHIINAAGVYVEKIAAMIEKEVPYKINPRRGEYYVLDRRTKGFVNRTIYPVPSVRGKGVLLVPQIHGNILVGPNAVEQESLDNYSNTPDGLRWVRNEASRIVQNIPFDQIIRTFTGIRPSIQQYDFYIEESLEADNFFHVAGIDSPGLTAAPAIAEYVEEILKGKMRLVKKESYDPKRRKLVLYNEMTKRQQQKAFEEDKRYGNLICKCEKITEADVVKAIHSPIPATSVKAIKKRARAGAGLCQGGYCEHQVLKLLARELDKPLTQVDYYHPSTPLVKTETKVKP